MILVCTLFMKLLKIYYLIDILILKKYIFLTVKVCLKTDSETSLQELGENPNKRHF